jgi:hypothetical protein
MGLIQFAIAVVIVVAVVAVVLWFVRSSGVAIPQPLLIIGYAVVAVVAILFLAGLAGWGPVAVNWRGP